jgi:hypothetical protein
LPRNPSSFLLFVLLIATMIAVIIVIQRKRREGEAEVEYLNNHDRHHNIGNSMGFSLSQNVCELLKFISPSPLSTTIVSSSWHTHIPSLFLDAMLNNKNSSLWSFVRR